MILAPPPGRAHETPAFTVRRERSRHRLRGGQNQLRLSVAVGWHFVEPGFVVIVSPVDDGAAIRRPDRIVVRAAERLTRARTPRHVHDPDVRTFLGADRAATRRPSGERLPVPHVCDSSPASGISTPRRSRHASVVASRVRDSK